MTILVPHATLQVLLDKDILQKVMKSMPQPAPVKPWHPSVNVHEVPGDES